MEDLIQSLMKSLETSSGRSIGMVMAVIGGFIWWVVHVVRTGARKVTGAVVETMPEEPAVRTEPRKRLSLHNYHR